MNAEIDISNVKLETERLILRAWEIKDLDNFSIYDEIFTSTSNKDILNKIPEDSDESYVSY